MPELDLPTEFDAYAIVVLRRPDDAAELPEEEADELQSRHASYVMSLIRSGAAHAGGPFTDHSDPALRGLILFAVPLEEARGLAAEDPAVRRGQLVAESFTWMIPGGVLELDRYAPD
jgi:uncharacterized protein